MFKDDAFEDRIAVQSILDNLKSKVIELESKDLLKLEEYLLKINKHFFTKLK